MRRVVDRAGLRANLAADVNIAINTGGGSSRQSVVVRQHREATPAPEQQVPIDPEEHS